MFSKELLYKTEGIILNKEQSNDVDAVLTVYTRNRGKIYVKAKGVRKKESKLKGFLEPFSHNSFLLARSKTWADVLAGAETIEYFATIFQDVQRLALAFFIAETLDKTIVAPERDEEMWQFIVKVFQTLNDRKYAPEKIKVAFEKRILEMLGYGHSGKNLLNQICELAGEEIKSHKFLTQVLNA